ncbi:Gfo/Idh/MocA family protein [Endomicrobium proavitum]|uniref:Oxidoreductase family protein n=1 Tax=Endomicrobium proavitum TaxID=1408281 RepID=A0A0G3WIX0_9BACT|nr:Gfo/Idh/MocA family oxidoreductase [Endomicrobium proavitum]AKL97835.1 Oxidoreductase family protein [Endomicrobium proavitum]
MNIVKTAVIGAGSLGQHHARILGQHPGSKLEYVVDTDVKRGEKIAKANNAQHITDFNFLIGKVDAAVISAPTQFHYAIAKPLLESGVHCLVEKPFTLDVAQAEELIEIAQKKNLVLQVGHVERFNPAIIAAAPFVNNPKFIEINRLGPYDPRTAHIGVVLDLMVHDLDMLFYLVKDKVVSLEAHGAKVLSDTEDIAKVRLKFANGCVADVSASRITIDRYRKIRIFQPDAYISVDYAGKSVKIYKQKEGVQKMTSLLDIEIKKPKIPSNEPLFYELDNFLTSIIDGKKPAVAGEQGRDAVELALNILKHMVF